MKLQVRGREVEAQELGKGRLLVDVKSVDALRDLVEGLVKDDRLQPVYLQAITAVDNPEQGVIELYYLFWCHGIGSTVALRVAVPRDNPRVKSIADIVPGAAPHEAEAYDLLGVEFEGSPMAREGFLKPPELKGLYPLRKEAKSRARS